MEDLIVIFNLENETQLEIPDQLRKSLHNRQLTFKICDVKPYENDKMIFQVSLTLKNEI